MLRHPEEFYGYFVGLQRRKGWDGPFTIKKIKQNREIVIWDEFMWYTYVDPSEINLIGQEEEEDPAPKRFRGTTV